MLITLCHGDGDGFGDVGFGDGNRIAGIKDGPGGSRLGADRDGAKFLCIAGKESSRNNSPILLALSSVFFVTARVT